MQQVMTKDEVEQAVRLIFSEQAKRKRSDTGRANIALGQYIAGERERRHLTRTELARRAGLHHSTPQKIEEGIRGVSLTTMARIYHVFLEHDRANPDPHYPSSYWADEFAGRVLEIVWETQP